MTCSEFEIQLCEYVDGTLDQTRRREAEEHASGCKLCAALMADSALAQQFLERVEPPEAPPELVTSILYRTRHARSARWAAAGGWRAWLQPLLQPRFAMSMRSLAYLRKNSPRGSCSLGVVAIIG